MNKGNNTYHNFKTILLDITFIVLITVFILFILSSVTQAATAIGPGNALRLDGQNDYINVGNKVLGLKNKLTVSAWVRWEIDPSTGNGWANIFTMGSSTQPDDGQFWLQHNKTNTKFEFAVRTTNGRAYVWSTTKPEAWKWYHITGVYTNKEIKIYINGVLEGTKNLNGFIAAHKGTYLLQIGQWAHPLQNYRRFTGSIDEVTLWKKQLNNNTLRSLMCSKTKSKSSTLLGYWNFDEGIGKTLYDQSKYHKDATIFSSKWVLSGAPIGDYCIFDFKLNSYDEIKLRHPGGDTLSISIGENAPMGINIYYYDTIYALSQEFQEEYKIIEPHTWGVHIINPDTAGHLYTHHGKLFTHKKRTAEDGNMIFTRPAPDSLGWKKVMDPILGISSIAQVSSKNVSEYLIGSLITPLPIDLVFFRSEVLNNKVMLHWRSSREEQNDYYIVERSIDGHHFNEIARITGAGDSYTNIDYNYIDKEKVNEMVYYRLTQVDFEGKPEVLNVILTDTKKISRNSDLISIAPNPFEGEFECKYFSQNDTRVEIMLTNQEGHIMYYDIVNSNKGINTFTYVDNIGITAGIYYLRVTGANNIVSSTKILKY